MANPASAAPSSSAPSCSASTSNVPYDVFINHRGEVKETVAQSLYRRLLGHGVRAFLDKPKLIPGEEIDCQLKYAIQVSSIHIAIFSPKYADSEWCLNELTQMVELRQTKESTILPVFYKVKPSEVRHTNAHGLYADALRGLQEKRDQNPQTGENKKRYESSIIQKWRDALAYAAGISGFELENGDDEELLNKVVQRVLEIVSKQPLHLAKYPTGLDEKLKEFEMEVLQRHEEQVKACKVVGIVGCGGVGKTTLANAFFHRERSHYNKSSFLPDVREYSTRQSIVQLHRKLLKDFELEKNIESESPYEGIEILKQHLSSYQALIVLDNVDNANQIDVLLPMRDILNPESLILVTTRDKHVLEMSGVSSIYNLTGLNTLHSKELFCCYAFFQPFPPSEFSELVHQFVTACGGLPLSLKVVGALVCGKDEKLYWEGQLEQLQKTPPEEILQTLKISYLSLSEEDRPIFLDIACFFLGENRDKAIWGLVGVQNLEDKCLLEIDSENKIQMHDHIKDCARSIAKAEKSMPLRLWTANMIEDLLRESSSVEVRGITSRDSSLFSDVVMQTKHGEFLINWGEAIEMMWYNSSEMERRFNGLDFPGMKNLQLLDTEDAFLERVLRRVQFPQLKWLRWYGRSRSCLPDWIPMNHLRVLEVAGSSLKSLWSHEKYAPVELRELNILAPLSEFPKSIGQLKHLEWITIGDREDSSSFCGVRTLPEEFCDLSKLKYLVFLGLSRLVSLPDSFGKPTNLQHITLSDASSLKELPSSLGDLTRLKHLSITGAKDMMSLPNSFGELTSLQHINLEGACGLKTLPDNCFGKLTRLKHLSLTKCSNLTISNGALENITTLEYLYLQGCKNVKELSVAHQRSLKELNLAQTGLKELPSRIEDLCNLEVLKIGNHSLEVLPPSFVWPKSLKVFSVQASPKLNRLPDSLAMLTQLRELDLLSCGVEYLPQDLLNINNLETLEVHYCPLRELSLSLKGGRALRRLMLWSTSISEVAFPEGDYPNLHDLQFVICPELTHIGGLGQLTKLWFLHVYGCQIVELPGVEHCTSLSRLYVYDCRKLKSIEGLRKLTRLSCLIVSGCHEIVRLPGVEHCTSLRELEISKCPKLECITGLRQLTMLEKLKVSGCHEIVGLPGVEHCKSLEELDASSCPKLKSIAGLEQLTKLGTLNVSGCHKIAGLLSVLKHCTSLRDLDVSECPKLKCVTGLGQLTMLERLEVRGCHEIVGLPGVEHCTSLEYLNASDCCNLKSIGLRKLIKLTHLYVSECDDIVELPGLEHCTSLEKLDASSCPELKSIAGLGQLKKLGNLNVSGCHKIVGLSGLEQCTSLEELDVSFCPKLKSIAGLRQLTKLGNLNVRGCDKIVGLPGLEYCTSLEELDARWCPKLKSIAGLAKLTRLRRLNVSGCQEIVGLLGMKHCTSLEDLDASNCPKLKNIAGLGQITMLEKLNVSGCTSLEKLDASGCPKLKSIAGLAKLPRLRHLNVSGCQEIVGLPGVKHCSSLEYLDASECPKVKNIERLGQLTMLEKLNVSGCRSLEKLDASGCNKLKNIEGLGQLTMLEELNVSGCLEIVGLPGVEHCTSLKYLNASKCPKLWEANCQGKP